MKKSYLMIAAAALFAACMDQDTFKESVQEQQTPQALSFSAYADKVTKGSNSAALNDFYDVFSVWGFKKITRTVNNVDEDVDEAVFDNDPVEYFATDAAGDSVYTSSKPSSQWFKQASDFTAGWYYEDVRYWDKLAKSYEFFAVAPYVETGDYTVEAGFDNVKIKSAESPYDISTEENLAFDADADTLISKDLSYAGFNRDYMVATKINRAKENNVLSSQKVDFVFKHILAKLNVKIKLGESYIGGQDLIVNELKINGLAKKGYYIGNTDLTGWTTTADRYARDITTDFSLTDTTKNYSEYYWLETLMFPQTATCKKTDVQSTSTGMTDMYLYINYHIGNENYEVYADFASIWKDNASVDETFSFAQGNEYNLTITLGPEAIKFDATVYEWVKTDRGASF